MNRPTRAPQQPSEPASDDASTLHDRTVPLPQRGLLDRDWQKALVIFLTLLAFALSRPVHAAAPTAT